MKKSCFCNVMLAGVSLTEYGLEIPSPFASIEFTNSEIQSFTQWNLHITVGGDDTKKVNASAFEALLYSAAQAASGYKNASGIPFSCIFGWLDSKGNVSEYLSYQGFTLQFSVSTQGRFLTYNIQGFASLAVQSSMPVLNIPELSGIVQPSAVVEGLAHGIKATRYYDLDIDHNDVPTLVSHGALTTSFNSYVRGTYSGDDDYDTFPGLLKLSKSYNGSRDACGLKRDVASLRQVLDCQTVTPINKFLKPSITDETPQCVSFSFWVDEPTMTKRGTIHYKSNAGLAGLQLSDTLRYGTSDSNVFSVSGSYNGVAYNMTDMNFSQVGFSLDGSGNTIASDATVVNSWSSSLAGVFQTVNIINDVNAIASQFSGEFEVIIPGSTKKYMLAQPISLLVMSGNTISPITGVYNIMSITHSVSNTFITKLRLQRLVMSTANQVAANQGIYISGSKSYPRESYTQTSNIISTTKVDFGVMYPTYEHIVVV